MHRKTISLLNEWKIKKNRKPLLLRGSRQVGKTWLVRSFAKSFDSFIEINLESNPEYINLFDNYYGQPEQLLIQISLLAEKPVLKAKTLLFIDEIQESPKALLSLRYFYEKLPDQYVIAAGSLVEFCLKEISFPVGRIEFLYLFPLSFSEYLAALGRKDINTALYSITKNPLSKPVEDYLLQQLKIYYFLGGMPEIIKTYIDTNDLQKCSELQNDLINTFRADFNKYASKAKVPHIKLIFDSIPRLLGQKFKYSNVSENLKSRELSIALDLLCDAGLAYKCYHTSANGVPLTSEINSKKFKVFFLDIGLSSKILGISPKDFPKMNWSNLIHRGGMSEQFVAQELISITEKGNSPQLFFWQREAMNASAEVDFVIAQHDKVIPIEVKSGRSRFSKSLSLFIEEKKSQMCLKISESSFKKHSGSPRRLELPLYAITYLSSDDWFE